MQGANNRSAPAGEALAGRPSQVMESLGTLESAVVRCERAAEMIEQRLERVTTPLHPSPEVAGKRPIEQVIAKVGLADQIDCSAQKLSQLADRMMLLLQRVEV